MILLMWLLVMMVVLYLSQAGKREHSSEEGSPQDTFAGQNIVWTVARSLYDCERSSSTLIHENSVVGRASPVEPGPSLVWSA